MKIIKKIKHKILNNIKIIYFIIFRNTKYKYEKIKSNEVIIHHHLGLGDLIICNGIINFLSNDFDKIYIPTFEKNLNHTKYLYSGNSTVEIFKIKDENEIYQYKPSVEKLRIGFEKNYGEFNYSYYKQLNLPYSYSFDYFKLPKNKENENKLYKYLMEYYGVQKEFILIHRTSSQGEVNLQTRKDIPSIFVEKQSDIFKNIFLYNKLVKDATEIHCIDSSFLHLVERIETNAELYFHPVKKVGKLSEKLKLSKKWNIIA